MNMQAQSAQLNRHLFALVRATPVVPASRGRIELPEQSENIRWQNRDSEPTEHEMALADAIVRIYASGGSSPEEFAAGLNRVGVLTASGETWTAASIAEEMARLGA